MKKICTLAYLQGTVTFSRMFDFIFLKLLHHLTRKLMNDLHGAQCGWHGQIPSRYSFFCKKSGVLLLVVLSPARMTKPPLSPSHVHGIYVFQPPLTLTGSVPKTISTYIHTCMHDSRALSLATQHVWRRKSFARCWGFLNFFVVRHSHWWFGAASVPSARSQQRFY